MNNPLQSDIFWGKYAPLSTLAGAFLLILASSRLAFAILCGGALLWVYCLTALVYYSCWKFLPKKGKIIILLFLSTLICNLYLLLISLLNPLLAAGSWFFLVFIPPCCIGSDRFERLNALDIRECLPRVFLEAGCLGLLIIAISLIREPLGMGSLSFPGGIWGITEVFNPEEDGEGFFPIRLLSVSAGGLLILGFVVAVFRFFRNQKSIPENDL